MNIKELLQRNILIKKDVQPYKGYTDYIVNKNSILVLRDKHRRNTVTSATFFSVEGFENSWQIFTDDPTFTLDLPSETEEFPIEIFTLTLNDYQD